MNRIVRLPLILCTLLTIGCGNRRHIPEEPNEQGIKEVTFGIYCGLYVFNFLYDAHVIYTYFRVKKIVSTVNLNGIDSYKNGIKPFIIFDILILFGLSSDFSIKLYRFIKFRRNQNIILNNWKY